jgi:hypothetical protein
MQVTSRCNMLVPVRQSSFNSRSARMSFSQVQRVFIVEHYLASRSYLTCQNEFRDTFPYFPVPNKSTISRLVNRYRDTGTLHRVASNIRKRVNACIAERGGHFQRLFFSDFNVIYFLTNRTCVRNGLCDFSMTLYCWSYQIKEDAMGGAYSARGGEEKCVKNLVGKPELKRPLRRFRLRWEDSITRLEGCTV